MSQIGKEIDLPFDNPKSKQLLMELVKLADLGVEDIVLDFSPVQQPPPMLSCNLTPKTELSANLLWCSCPKCAPRAPSGESGI